MSATRWTWCLHLLYAKLEDTPIQTGLNTPTGKNGNETIKKASYAIPSVNYPVS